jgi:hypothetical protein
MATTDMTLEYANRLLENDYVQDKLREAAAKLRGARQRAAKRRVNPATDGKVQAQLREAALAFNEAASAFRAGRTKPKRSWGRRIFVVTGVGAAGAVVALAASDELREKLFGDAPAPATDAGPSPEPVAEETASGVA